MAGSKKHPHLWKEITGIILIGLAIFITCCLITYYPDDPSFSVGYSRIPHRIHNWSGYTGAYISDGLFWMFGIMAFVSPVVLLFIAKKILFPSQTTVSFYVRMGLIVIILLCISIFLSLYVGKLTIPKYQHFDGGGLLGSFLAKQLVKYLNVFGSYFAIILLTLLAVMLLTKISYVSISKKFLQSSVKGGQKVNHVISHTFKTIEWPFKRKKKNKGEKIVEEKILDIEPDIEWVEWDSAAGSEDKIDIDSKGDTKKQKESPHIRDEVVIKEPRAGKAPEKDTFKPSLRKTTGTIQLPPLDLLDSPKEKDGRISRESLKEDAQILIQKLEDFNIKGKVTEISPGPVITRFEFEPAPGIKINRIVGLSDDLALALKAISIRIVAPIPGKCAVGIELANKKRETVFFKEIVSREEFLNPESKLTIGFGKNIAGDPVINDLARMPHLLIAGSTGSGKSVLINTIICSILYKATPDEVKFLMIDPKRLELSLYEGIPHLLHPVVTDPKKAAIALRWGVEEMERRYKKLAEKGVRDIVRYNQKVDEEQASRSAKAGREAAPADAEEAAEPDTKMPYIVVVIDELADLMMVAARDVEVHIARLAQMARAAGIHLIVATQRPSVDILTGTIKVNFPCRISFQVTSKVDSRTILDTIGAERLLGRGDMLFLPPGSSKMQRIHGSFLSEQEIARIVEFIKKQMSPSYDETILLTAKIDEADAADDDFDELYDQALQLVAETGQASISMLQRRLRVGYNRAARMIEKMEQQGVVGPSDGVKPRNVLVNRL
ncbi:MAG: DNA translocase FtsK 4TM domain-containing protein [Proteobacteria bacterium]|nr:DNA translocase FtsK 4TM domain-containing protein [Pseudomonadota bacterium]